MRHSRVALVIAVLVLTMPGAWPQSSSDTLAETGHIEFHGRSAAYVIRHLPPDSFPDLPAPIVSELLRRSCLIPQTYEAHQPENVVHASLERAGSSDWAVLCSVRGAVSLLVFFGDAPQQPFVLATSQETQHLQPQQAVAALGFNWGLDAASPTRVHQAQAGLDHRPPRPDHDALADSVLNGRTTYHFFTRGRWTILDMPPD